MEAHKHAGSGELKKKTKKTLTANDTACMIFDTFILWWVEITTDFYFLKDLLQTWQQALFIPAVMQQHPASILHLMFSSVSSFSERQFI